MPDTGGRSRYSSSWTSLKLFSCTRCQIFHLKCTKFNFRLGLRSRPRWGAHSAPQTPIWIWGKGKGERGGKGEGKGEGRRVRGMGNLLHEGDRRPCSTRRVQVQVVGRKWTTLCCVVWCRQLNERWLHDIAYRNLRVHARTSRPVINNQRHTYWLDDNVRSPVNPLNQSPVSLS